MINDWVVKFREGLPSLNLYSAQCVTFKVGNKV